MFAAAMGINLFIFDSNTLAQLYCFSGHIGPIHALAWNADDSFVYSTGADGNVYGWNVVGDKRSEDAGLLNRSAAYLSIITQLRDPAKANPQSQLVPRTRKRRLGESGADDEDDEEMGHSQALDFGGRLGTAASSGLVGDEDGVDGLGSGEDDTSSSTGGAGGVVGSPTRKSTPAGSKGWSRVVVSCVEGGLRELRWDPDVPDSAVVRDFRGADDTDAVTRMVLDENAGVLYAGTAAGRVRLYDWPVTGAYRTLDAHAAALLPAPASSVGTAGTGGAGGRSGGPRGDKASGGAGGAATGGGGGGYGSLSKGLTGLCLAREGQILVSAGSDGCVLVQAVTLVEDGLEVRSVDDALPNSAVARMEYNADTLLVSREFVDDLYQQLEELKKSAGELQSDLDFNLHRKEAEWVEHAKRATDDRDALVATERNRREKLETKLVGARSEQQAEADAVERRHVVNISELENAYEGKLGVAMARYERLKQSIQTCRADSLQRLEQSSHEQDEQSRALEKRSMARRRVLERDAAKLFEDCKHEGITHREVLSQQESEYEAEVSRLMDIANNELHEQRSITAKLRAKVQVQNTKLVQMKKKMAEIERHTHGTLDRTRDTAGKNDRLASEVAALEESIAQRQLVLDHKEAVLAELTSQHDRLEKFRFVLDSKLQAMHGERVPLSDEVSRLDKARKGIYDVLIQEFQGKKATESSITERSNEEEAMVGVVADLRQKIRERERQISSFKRELSFIVELTTPDDLRRGLRDIARLFVEPEDDIEEQQHSPESQVEAADSEPGNAALNTEIQSVVRERDHITSMNVAQQKAIDRTQNLARLSDIIRTHEGTWIVDECNRLRRENIDIRRRERHLESQLETWLARRGDQRSLDETLGERASELQSLRQPTVDQHTKPLRQNRRRRRRPRGHGSLSSQSLDASASEDLRSAVDESRMLASQQADSIQELRDTLAGRNRIMAAKAGKERPDDLRSLHSASTYMPQWSIHSAVSLHQDGISVTTHRNTPGNK